MTEIADPLDLAALRELVCGGAVAIRGRATLEPAGGPGDKVFPPTHSVRGKKDDDLWRMKPDERRGVKYAGEWRRRPTSERPAEPNHDSPLVWCVLLDSVQSQANRMEEALEALWAANKIVLPVIRVNFGGVADDVTSLSAPHRVADALLRDSVVIDGTEGESAGPLFRLSKIGKSFTDASARNASALFNVCPTGLVFGLWDSTGPRGGRGAKFARALTSEIVGIAAQVGVKSASRIDPSGIVTAAGPIFVARENDAAGQRTWTLDVMEAKPLDDKKPPSSSKDVALVEKWGKGEKAGKPTAINHSNIPPTIDDVAGGVTIDHAEQTVVLSLAALRKLSFGGDGDDAARTVLAALALLAVLEAEQRGHDLRSRCLLVPRKGCALALECVARDGTTTKLNLNRDRAIKLYQEAVEGLPPQLRFKKFEKEKEKEKEAEQLEAGESLATLVPSPKLRDLVTKSRELAAAGDVEED